MRVCRVPSESGAGTKRHVIVMVLVVRMAARADQWQPVYSTASAKLGQLELAILPSPSLPASLHAKPTRRDWIILVRVFSFFFVFTLGLLPSTLPIYLL